MKRSLLPSAAFIRNARRFTKKHPGAEEQPQAALELLAEDAHHPTLRSHKLKGKLAQSWGCSAGCDLRIVFHFVQEQGADAILLEAVGTHDEVY